MKVTLNLGRLHVLLMACVLAWTSVPGQEGPAAQSTQIDNIEYLGERSTDTIQRLNLVLPKTSKSCPLLVWIGGGAWSYVDRHVEMDLARKIAEEGIAVASIGHRLSPATWRNPDWDKGVRHPAHALDVAASIKWLYDHAVHYGYDREKIYIGGFSSGAHLAALIGLDWSYLRNEGLHPSVIKGMIPISGAFDIVNYYEVFKSGTTPELAQTHVAAVFGDTQEAYESASPTSYLDHLNVPMLLMADNAIDRYTRLLEERLSETEFKAYQVLYAPDLNHAELWRDISFNANSRYRQAMVDFIRGNGALP